MVTSNKSDLSQTFLRDSFHPPRTGQFLAVHPGNLDVEKLSRFIDDVWSQLITRLTNPIFIHEDGETREVVFVGAIRYIVDKRSGVFRSETLERTENGLKFVEEKACVAIDPPLRANGGWIQVFLNQWWDEMAAVLVDHTKPGDCWLATVRRIFWNSIRKSTYWKRLRLAMRAALQLDQQILRWSRQGRSRHVNQCVTNHQYNRSIAFRKDYEQVERDNPNLVWLITLMLDEKIELPPGEVLAAMKSYLAGRSVTPAGWRLLANGTEHQFRHIRDWIGPNGELSGRLAELPYWLRFMVALRRKSPLPSALREIFLHDSFNTQANGLVRFRSAWMPVKVVNSILNEAERRLQGDCLKSFLADDVNEVVSWLEAEKPCLDSNQLRAGWKFLASSAAAWKVEKEMAGEFGQLQWKFSLGDVRIREWTVVPLDDAWKLRSEGLLQKHCGDRYISDCLAGNKRLFSVRHQDGRRVATIGIELSGDAWRSIGIRRSCNRAAGPGLEGLDDEVASRYTDLWRLAQPVPPAWPKRIVRDAPVYFDSLGEASCPICGGEGVYCHDHTIACYDIAESFLIGGSIDDVIEPMEETARAIIAAAIRNDIRSIGLGDDFDVILGYVRDDMGSMESLEDAIDNWSRKIRIALYDSALDYPEVCQTIADSDGGMPGLSSSYCSYWAANPDLVVTRLEERLGAVRDWLTGLNESVDAGKGSDEAVLRVHENRLGIEVDRKDPMLPAVIAMERALMDMFNDERSTRPGD